VLAAAGFNFSLLLRWFAELLRVLLLILCRHLAPPHSGAQNILHGRRGTGRPLPTAFD
jgi:hypothetical protein